MDRTLKNAEPCAGHSCESITLPAPGPGTQFKNSSNTEVSIFDDEALVFNADTLKVYFLNSVSLRILQDIFSGMSLNDVARSVMNQYETRYNRVMRDVVHLAGKWEQAGLILRDIQVKAFEESSMDTTRYLANPGISCRIEEPEGAILYDGHRDVFQVINTTGLAIWNAMQIPRNVKEIAYEIVRQFEDVPVETLSEDIQEFIETLVKIDFVRELNRT